MSRMQRATIEEAAKSLGVTQNDIELQIKSGSLVPCQDPSFRRCVWISESDKPKLKRAAKSTLKKDTPKRDAPKNDLESASLVQTDTNDELRQKTELVLEPELKIRKPRAKRKAKETPERETPERETPEREILEREILEREILEKETPERVTPKIDSDSLGFSDPDQDIRLLLQSVALVNPELEISKDKARRRAKDTKETPSEGVDPVEAVGPAKETGLLQKTVDLLYKGLEITPPKLRRKAPEAPQAPQAPQRDTGRNYLDLIDRGEPAKETGILQKTVNLLNTELEITAPILRRRAKETSEKETPEKDSPEKDSPEKDSPEIDTPEIGADVLGLNHPDSEIGLLLQTVAMLNAELEISEAEARRQARDAKETKDTSPQKTPRHGVDSAGIAEPAKETGLLQKTVDLLNTELEITPPKLKRKAKEAAEGDTPSNNLDLLDAGGPAKEIGLLQKTVDLLNTELEITAPKLKRKATETSEKDASEKASPKKDGELVGLAKLAKEMELLQATVAVLKAELEIRDERLDLLSVQLESTREEVRKLRPLLGERLESRSNEVQQLRSLLGSIKSSEQALKTEPDERAPQLPAFADAVDPIDDEVFVTVGRPPEPEPPIRASRLSYASIFRRSFRPFIGLMCFGFGLPLFH